MSLSVELYALCFLCSFLYVLCSSGIQNHHSSSPTVDFRREDGLEEGRIFWASMGDLIEAVPFFPVTLNIPDMVYGFAEAMGNVFQYMFGGGSSEGGTTGGSTPRIYLRLLQQLIDYA